MAMAINGPTRTLINAQDRSLAHILDAERCPRCGGLMVSEWCLDLLDDTGEIDFTARRCVQCGDVIDPVILRNRALRALSDLRKNEKISKSSAC